VKPQKVAHLVTFVLALLWVALPVRAEPQQQAERPEQAGTAGDAVGPLVGQQGNEALTAEARAEFEAGARLFNERDYSAALVKFNRAHELSQDPRALYNVALCQHNLGEYAQALASVQRYLELEPPEAGRDRATELLEDIAQFVSPLWVQSNEAGARVFIDDEPVATTPMQVPVTVNQGRRLVRVTKPGFRPAAQWVRIRGSGHQERVTLNLRPTQPAGRLVVVAAPGQSIWLDGSQVGRGRHDAVVPAGAHTVRVAAPGMQAHEQRLTVRDAGVVELRVTLAPEPEPPPAEPRAVSWPPLLAWAVAAAGAVVAVGGYFMLEPDEPTVAGSSDTARLDAPFWNPRTLVVLGGTTVAVSGAVAGYYLYEAEEPVPSPATARKQTAVNLVLLRGGW
jgi:hypothetical protein